MKTRLSLFVVALMANMSVCLAQFVSYEPVYVPQSTYTPPPTYSNRSGVPYVRYTPTPAPVQRYEAYVRYNSSTGHDAEYNLNVGVRDGRVVAIYFGNGGQVHSGTNNSGYTYSGGALEKVVDDGELFYITKVTIKNHNGSWQTYIVII